jgi:DNA-binding transcriptional MerR regulator
VPFVSGHAFHAVARGVHHPAVARRRDPRVCPGPVAVKLKGHYSSREVAAETGLTARQLQWWDERGIFAPSLPTHKTPAGGYTERRYTPIELIELKVLADLRRRGLSVARIRTLLSALRSRFKVRLFDAVEDGGPVALFIDGHDIYARTTAGEYYNLLENPRQPLLVLDQEPKLRRLTARDQSARPKRARPAARRAPGGTATRA